MTSPQASAQRALSKPVTSVSPNVVSPADALANVLSECKHRSKLGLSLYTASAAQQAAEHRDKLGISGRVKDVASVHKTLWPEETGNKPLLSIGILTGEIPLIDDPTPELDNDDPRRKREELA